jgi:HAD superfamily hydrolase (TIGR01549 family)
MKELRLFSIHLFGRKQLMTVKAVFFDLDDTLHDHLAPFTKTIEKIFPQYDPTLSMIDLYKTFRHYSDLLWIDYSNRTITLEKLRIQRIQLALNDYGMSLSDSEAEIFQFQYEKMLENLQLFPEVLALMEKLTDLNYTIGIITNGPVDHQWNKIRSLKLLTHIKEDHIFVSDGVGAAKPNPAIFNFASKKVDVLPENMIYVGDSWVNDVIAPMKAGWQSVWYNHRRRNPGTNDKPLAEIYHLMALLEVLEININ